MWLLINNADKITSLITWSLISLTMEGVPMLIRTALVNLDFNNLSLRYNLPTLTLLALVLWIDNLSLSTALVAVALCLHYHWAHALHLDDDTSPLALATSLYFTTALSRAVYADAITLDGNLAQLAVVYVC